jgi:hypothetical protein
MKVVINRCFGGFGLSQHAITRLAELQGRRAYFFEHGRDANGNLNLHRWVPATNETALFWTAFDIPNPNELLRDNSDWHDMTTQEKDAANALYESHHLDDSRDNRTDPFLIQVVEELGKDANGGCAELAIVEIPDGTDYTIEEYDGNEHIAETHRTWR